MAEGDFCKACFDGRYPVGVEGVLSSTQLELGAQCD
jgi:hypothetical protein